MFKQLVAAALLSAAAISHAAPLSDLTLGNFFSSGWSDDWAKRERASGTPDYALLRVQTNFLEREFRLNGFYQSNINSAVRQSLYDVDGLAAWGFNRRLMLAVVGNFQWADNRAGTSVFGSASAAAARVQLVDTECGSLALNLRATAPNSGLGENGALLSYGLAGFDDLGKLWDQLGLYYSVGFDSFTAVPVSGERHTQASVIVTPAKTLLPTSAPVVGALTVFLENVVQSDLDGTHSGRTSYGLSPGVRFSPAKENWFLFGVDLPVAGYRNADAIYRFSYIRNI